MRDILFLKGDKRKKGTLKERGISLFREIPIERTCRNAGIPDEFCACGKFSEPKVNQETLATLGLTLLNKINSFIGHSAVDAWNSSAISIQNNSRHQSISGDSRFKFTASGMSSVKAGVVHNAAPRSEEAQPLSLAAHYQHKCARLRLERVESLYQVSNIQLNSLKEKTYRVAVRLSPGLGLFEGLVNYDRGQLAEVKGGVVRINMYRGQADCVQDPWLRQFCYCVG